MRVASVLHSWINLNSLRRSWRTTLSNRGIIKLRIHDIRRHSSMIHKNIQIWIQWIHHLIFVWRKPTSISTTWDSGRPQRWVITYHFWVSALTCWLLSDKRKNATWSFSYNFYPWRPKNTKDGKEFFSNSCKSIKKQWVPHTHQLKVDANHS